MNHIPTAWSFLPVCLHRYIANAHFAGWLQNYFSYICTNMNRDLHRIVVLLLATVALIAHASVRHHHHGSKVFLASFCDSAGSESDGHEHDTDGCDGQCSAKEPFILPKHTTHTQSDVCKATVDPPLWAVAITYRTEAYISNETDATFYDTPPLPLCESEPTCTSLRAPPVNLI